MPTLRSRAVAATFLAVTAILIPAVAFAQDTDIEESESTWFFELSPWAVSIILGTVLPLLVGFVTKVSTSSAVKAVLLAALSAVSGLIVQATTESGGAVLSQEALIAAGITFVVSVATYFGFWTPTGVTAKVQSVGVKD